MGVGYTIEGQGGDVLVRVGAQLGDGTNNIAEYMALIYGLRHALRYGMWNIRVDMDSNLLVQQVKGRWAVKDKALKLLHREATTLLSLFHSWEVRHIYREYNGGADDLSRKMVYEEPPLPAPSPRRALLGWQAAALKVWWRTRTRNTYMLGRIFGISDTQVDQIGQGTSYRDATFEGTPEYPSLTSQTANSTQAG